MSRSSWWFREISFSFSTSFNFSLFNGNCTHSNLLVLHLLCALRVWRTYHIRSFDYHFLSVNFCNRFSARLFFDYLWVYIGRFQFVFSWNHTAIWLLLFRYELLLNCVWWLLLISINLNWFSSFLLLGRSLFRPHRNINVLDF